VVRSLAEHILQSVKYIGLPECIAVVKIDPSGVELWRRTLSTSAFDDPTEVAIDADDNVYIAGRTGGLLGEQHFGNDDAFLAKYDPHGHLLWLHQFGTPNWDILSSIAADAHGNVVVTGYAADAAPPSGALGFSPPIPGSAWVGLFRGTPVPEPSSWALALGALVVRFRRK
jgi:hypothetical protein